MKIIYTYCEIVFDSRNSCQPFSLHTCANNNNKYNNNNINNKTVLPALMLLVTMFPVLLIWNEFCFGRIDYMYDFIWVELFSLPLAWNFCACSWTDDLFKSRNTHLPLNVILVFSTPSCQESYNQQKLISNLLMDCVPQWCSTVSFISEEDAFPVAVLTEGSLLFIKSVKLAFFQNLSKKV